MAKKAETYNSKVLSLITYKGGYWICTDGMKYLEQKPAYIHQLGLYNATPKSSKAPSIEDLLARIEALEARDVDCKVEISKITVTGTSGNYIVTSADKSYASIRQLINNGKMMAIQAIVNGNKCMLSLASLKPESITFVGAYNENSLFIYNLWADGTKDFLAKSFSTEEVVSAILQEALDVYGVEIGDVKDHYDAGTYLEEILNDMLHKEIDVEPINPSAGISVSTVPELIYVGDNAECTFTDLSTVGVFVGQPGYDYYEDAGCSYESTLKRGNVEITTNPYHLDALSEAKTVAFDYNLHYGDSTVIPVKNNGEASEKRISEGDSVAHCSVNVYWPYFLGEWDGDSSKAAPVGITVEDIRSMRKGAIKGNSTKPITSRTVSQKYFKIICVPVGYSVTAKNEFGAYFELGTSIQIEGVIGGVSKTYKIYYIQGSPIVSEIEIKKV